MALEKRTLSYRKDRSTFAPARLNEPIHEVGALATRLKKPSAMLSFCLEIEFVVENVGSEEVAQNVLTNSRRLKPAFLKFQFELEKQTNE